MELIKIGVAGVGIMGMNHCRTLDKMKNVHFVGVYDTDMKRCRQVAEDYHVFPCLSFSELLKKVDAVIISVPTNFHYTFIQQALQEEKHVLVEKPFVSSIKEAEQIKKLIKAKNVIVQVGHVERFNPVVQQLSKIINHQKMISIETRRLGAINRTIDIDVILDLMIHDIDIVLNLVRSPVHSITAAGFSLMESGQMDVANALITFKNGIIANLVANRLSQEKVRTLTVTEKDRLIKTDYITKGLFIYQKVDSIVEKNLSYRQESIVEKIIVPNTEPLFSELDHFVQCVRMKQSTIVGPEEASIALEIAEMIREYIKNNQ
jgi:predicted dehydrogenase